MRTLIVSPDRVQRTLSRMAYEVVESNQGADNLAIFGILKKGVPVAETLARHITPLAGSPVAIHPLDVAAFRDDRCHEDERNDPGRQVDVTRKHVVLVDDVLFTGRTARAALDAIVRYGRPATIQLAVLVDRGHREVPIQPNYTGRSIQTKARECIVVDAAKGLGIYVQE